MSELVHLSQLAEEAARDSWTPVDLNELPEQPPIQPQLGGTGLVYPGKRHVFSGPPESAKTLAAYCVLIQIVRLGGRAILMDFEMGAYDARQRLRELGATQDEISRIAYIEPDERVSRERIALLVATQPDLVVIDATAGVYSLEGLDDNKRGDVEKVSALYVKVFWRHSIATILIDHVVKDGEARGRYAIGSERKLGGADVHLGFDTITPISRGTTGKYTITTHKDRGGYLKRGHLADLSLDSDPDTHAIEWTFTEPPQTTAEAGYFRPTHLMEKVSIYLEMQSDPVTRNGVYEALGGTKDYILKAITALVAEGFVGEEDGPNRSRPIRSIRRYRENDESAEQTNGSTMPAEPHDSLPQQANTSESADSAQPSGGSVVRQWFGSGSRTTEASGGSVVRPPYGGDTTRPPAPDHPEQLGWFGTNGNLADTYYDTIAPEPEVDPDPDPDIDFGP